MSNYTNRKTNLFYLSGNDSNFLTFSNYTEYLTSVFLSTNKKMFLSKFLAFNLPFDDDEHNVENFKKYLMCYYENKLAVLRDNKDLNMLNIKTLNYLLEAIKNFFELNDNNIDETSESNVIFTNDENETYYKELSDVITYIGSIVEHDYNGTYADSICIVDFNRYYTAQVIYNNEETDNNLYSTEYTNVLYGWNNELDNIGAYEPIFDNENEHGYIYNSDINKIKYVNKVNDTDDSSYEIKFNCIIPLFDIFDIENESSNINEEDQSLILTSNEANEYSEFKNIPYGIWLSKHLITLYKDKTTGFGQSWSLVISSKFAPFPYGIKKPGNPTQETIDRFEKYTYSQLLAEQSKLYIVFQDSLNKIQLLQERVNELSQAVQAIATYSNIDDIREKLNHLDENIDNRIIENTKDIREMINNLKWKNIG